DVVPDLHLVQGGEVAEGLGQAGGRGLPLVLGEGDAGDPLGVLDHLRGDRPRRVGGRGGGGDGPVEGGGTEPEGGGRGEQLAAGRGGTHGGRSPVTRGEDGPPL